MFCQLLTCGPTTSSQLEVLNMIGHVLMLLRNNSTSVMGENTFILHFSDSATEYVSLSPRLSPTFAFPGVFRISSRLIRPTKRSQASTKLGFADARTIPCRCMEETNISKYTAPFCPNTLPFPQLPSTVIVSETNSLDPPIPRISQRVSIRPAAFAIRYQDRSTAGQ